MQAKFAPVNISSSLGSNKKKWAKPNFLILKKLNWKSNENLKIMQNRIIKHLQLLRISFRSWDI